MRDLIFLGDVCHVVICGNIVMNIQVRTSRCLYCQKMLVSAIMVIGCALMFVLNSVGIME